MLAPPVKKPLSMAMAAMTLLCFLVFLEASVCPAARANEYLFHADVGTVDYRQVSSSTMEVTSAREREKEESAVNVMMKRWKLRDVPLGPDPLHHHAGVSRKPRVTPP